MPPDIDGAVADLLECVCGGLTLPTCVCVAYPGPPADDHCCECDEARAGLPGSGQATASLVSVYPAVHDRRSGRIDRAGPVTRKCTPHTLAAEVSLTVARCTPTVDEYGEPPSEQDLAAAAAQIHLDVVELERALSCCPDHTVAVGNVEVRALAPTGGCIAVEATATVLLEE